MCSTTDRSWVDEHVGQAETLLTVHDQVQNLGLDGDIQGRDGLVGHDEFRVYHQRPGDADALALAAGKFVGEATGPGRVHAHLTHDLGHLVPHFGGGKLREMEAHGFLQNLAHGHARVERRVGVLEDHLHLAPVGQHVRVAQVVEASAPEEDFSAGGRVQAEDRASQGGFAAAGLTHHGEDLAGVDVQTHGVDGLDRGGGEIGYAAGEGDAVQNAPGNVEMLDQV